MKRHADAMWIAAQIVRCKASWCQDPVVCLVPIPIGKHIAKAEPHSQPRHDIKIRPAFTLRLNHTGT